MKFSNKSSPSSNGKGEFPTQPSRYGSAWMTSISKSSKQNSSTCTQCETTRVEDSCGQGMSKGPPNLLLRLPSRSQRLCSRTHPLSNQYLRSLPPVHPQPNVDT